MKNITTKVLAGIGLTSLAINNASAAINPGDYQKDVATQGLGYQNTADNIIQVWVRNFMVFLILIAVLYGLWGGFNILTAGGDEEKVKTGKKIIINVLIGIVVIYVVGTLINFTVTLLSKTT